MIFLLIEENNIIILNDEIIQLFWLKKVQLIRDNQKSENRRDNIPEEIYSKLFNYIIEEINIKIWKNNSPNNNANNNVKNDVHNNAINNDNNKEYQINLFQDFKIVKET